MKIVTIEYKTGAHKKFEAFGEKKNCSIIHIKNFNLKISKTRKHEK